MAKKVRLQKRGALSDVNGQLKVFQLENFISIQQKCQTKNFFKDNPMKTYFLKKIFPNM